MDLSLKKSNLMLTLNIGKLLKIPLKKAKNDTYTRPTRKENLGASPHPQLPLVSIGVVQISRYRDYSFSGVVETENEHMLLFREHRRSLNRCTVYQSFMNKKSP